MGTGLQPNDVGRPTGQLSQLRLREILPALLYSLLRFGGRTTVAALPAQRADAPLRLIAIDRSMTSHTAGIRCSIPYSRFPDP